MIQYKDDRLYRDLITNKVRADIRVVLVAVMSYMESKGLDVMITSVLDEVGVSRKSSTHKDGRAIDIRTRDWPPGLADEVTAWINKRFSTGEKFDPQRIMLVAKNHNAGWGDHIHLQVAKRPLIIETSEGGINI